MDYFSIEEKYIYLESVFTSILMKYATNEQSVTLKIVFYSATDGMELTCHQTDELQNTLN
jgi:hypothetical protein